MSRFFVETKKDPQIGDDIYIEGSDARHISLVLRKAVGAELEVVCGNIVAETGFACGQRG